MEKFDFRKATTDDVQMLAELRIDFLTELSGQANPDIISKTKQELQQYFTMAVNNGSYIGYIALVDNRIASTGGMCMRHQPGNFKNPSGNVGYIMNMYTLPAYRKKGLSTGILSLLMDEAQRLKINALELHATIQGEPIYIKSGFLIHSEPTYRKYTNITI